MTIEDVKITIKNYILNSISQRELCDLCTMLNVQPVGRKIQIQRRLIDSVLVATNTDLLHRILFMINGSYNRDSNLNILGVNQAISSQARDSVQNSNMETERNINYQVNGYNQLTSVNGNTNLCLYRISNEVLDKCPINLRSEIVNGIDPSNIFIPNYTRYPNGFFSAPSSNPSFINGRVSMPNVQLPYCVKNTVISCSQFYCCQVVLHPLSLLIPKPTPNIVQPTRIMSKMQLQFTLSSSARHLITAHRTQVNNKRFFKWQVLVRFGVYDPSKPFPTSNDNVSDLPEYIPPYLTLFVNNANVQLWDILPSNSTAKEGKRHPRPINISDYLKFSPADDQGSRQLINVNWWQTPGVYQYYYFAVYLERKLSVNELFNRFVNKTHHVQMPISFTMNFIREKFSSNNQFKKKSDDPGENEDDDDLVISSVLPISLSCPVGKSRITCPLRGIYCQHLQCFDAHLYLMMNERRSVWKCPVCDSSASLNELFVDEYFLKILQEFSGNEDITEINVNPDGSYVPVAVKESREHKQHIGNIISNVDNIKTNNDMNSTDSSDSVENNPVILVESDDEENSRNKISPNNNPSTSVVSSNNNEIVDIPKQQQQSSSSSQPGKSSLTIDLTSDSEGENESKSQQPKQQHQQQPKQQQQHHQQPKQQQQHHQQPNLSISKLSNENKPSLFPQFPPQLSSSQNRPIMTPTLPQQFIAAKLPINNFMKSSESSRNVSTLNNNFPQSSSSDSRSLSNNRYHQTSFINTSSNNNSSQQPKHPQYSWLPQTQRFSSSNRSNEMFNNFMPLLKPCYPAQNYVNLIRPQAVTTPFTTINTVTNPCAMLPLLPRPIKVDPHLNFRTVPEKNPKVPIQANRNLQSKPPISNQEKPRQKLSSKRSASIQNEKRRSSRILNQHKKVYREKSISGEESKSEDDEDFDDNDSDIVSICRVKRKGVFDESTSSSTSSSSNRKRRRLVRDPSSSDEENSNKGKLVDKSDLMTNLKHPLVILNKLDPVVLKVYLKQNEILTNGVGQLGGEESTHSVPGEETTSGEANNNSNNFIIANNHNNNDDDDDNQYSEVGGVVHQRSNSSNLSGINI